MADVERLINDYARKARLLKRRLFEENFYHVYNEESAGVFLAMLREYKFITEMFRQLGITNWSDEDYKFEL